MRAPNDFPEASDYEVKSSADVPRPSSSSSPAKNDDGANAVNHSFLPPPPNTIERRTPPRPVYRYAAAAAAAPAAPVPRPPMPPTTSTSSRHSYYNPGYYAYGQYGPHYYHAGFNYGHRHPAGYRPTAQGKDATDVMALAAVSTANPTPICPQEDGQLPPSVTMSPTPPALPQRRDDIGSNTAPSTPPPVSSEPIPDCDINDKDVLSGRGGGTNNHPGNKEFRSLVDQYRSEYVLSKKWAKREIARNIVDSIRSDGGRFLKKEGSMWYDIGDQKAREKTSQALREGLAAKMRAAYAESSQSNGASSAPTCSPRQASSTPQQHRPETPAPVEATSSSSRSSPHHHEPEYYLIPPHGYQHYSPDSVTGHGYPPSADHHLDPTSSASYEPYDYAYPYEYSPEAYGPPPPSSPLKRRRLTYSTYSYSDEPKQTEAV